MISEKFYDEQSILDHIKQSYIELKYLWTSIPKPYSYIEITRIDKLEDWVKEQKED